MKKMGKSALNKKPPTRRKHQRSPVDLSDEMIGSLEMSGHQEKLVDIFRGLGYQVRSPTKQEFLKWAEDWYPGHQPSGLPNALDQWNRLEEDEGIKYGRQTHLILNLRGRPASRASKGGVVQIDWI